MEANDGRENKPPRLTVRDRLKLIWYCLFPPFKMDSEGHTYVPYKMMPQSSYTPPQPTFVVKGPELAILLLRHSSRIYPILFGEYDKLMVNYAIEGKGADAGFIRITHLEDPKP